MGAALILEFDQLPELRREKVRPQLRLVSGQALLQKDPDPGKLKYPGTVINSYAYCLNNPVMYTDPSGKFIPALIFAFAAVFGGSLISGMTIGAAAWAATTAVLSTAVGSLAAAVVQSAVTGKWGADFWSNFEGAFNISAAFLGIGAIAATAFGGGIASAGSNSFLQGYVRSKNPISILGFDFGASGLTLGSTGVMSGTSSIMGHELGHTLQFIGLSAIPNGGLRWTTYLGLGGLGYAWQGGATGSIGSIGAWWEGSADTLGGIFY